MILARVTGKVSRAPAEQLRPGGVTVASVGLTVNAGGEFLTANGIGSGRVAAALLSLTCGQIVELQGALTVRVGLDEDGHARAILDVRVREVSKPSANRANEQALA